MTYVAFVIAVVALLRTIKHFEWRQRWARKPGGVMQATPVGLRDQIRAMVDARRLYERTWLKNLEKARDADWSKWS